MRSSRNSENKAIIILFILVILIFAGLFLGRDHVFSYINSNVSLEQTTSQLLSSATSKEFDVDKSQVLDTTIFQKKKFQELDRNAFSLPSLGAGRKNPFQSINQ